MKYKQFILALVLGYAMSVAQPAQAGLWDWYSSPFTLVAYVARSAWQHVCPITKHELTVFEANGKVHITNKADELIERDNKSKQSINQNFTHVNSKHNGLAALADDIVRKSASLKIEAVRLTAKLKDLKNTHDRQIPEVQREAERLAKQYTAVLALMAKVKEQIEENAVAAASLEKQVKSSSESMNTVRDQIAQVTEQVKSQEKQTVRIRDIAREMIGHTKANMQADTLQRLSYGTMDGFSSATRHQ